MASTAKPTIVIIHGGWHVPESFEKLTNALKSAGFGVYVPRLLSVNEARPPSSDLLSDTVLIRDYVESLVQAGHTVVALMHSYGGQVGTNALYGLDLETRSAQGLKGGVSHLIYMTAYAVSQGISVMDKVKEFGHVDLIPIVFDIAEDGSCTCRDPKTMSLDPGSDDAEAGAYLDTLVRHWNGNCMHQALEHCAWLEIPVAYIYATEDVMLPLDYQKSFVEGIEKTGRKVQTFELATGHCPNFAATKGVVDVVNTVVL